MARVHKRVLKLVNFEVQKVQKPDCFDLMVNEVFLYTILAFRKHMSLLWVNLLHCLSSVEKCVYVIELLHSSGSIDDSLECPQSPVVLGDVAVPGEGVGRGSVILDADVPGLGALHLCGKCYLCQLSASGSVSPCTARRQQHCPSQPGTPAQGPDLTSLLRRI